MRLKTKMPDPKLVEILETLKKARPKRTGPYRERVASALEDISDRLELLAGILAVIGQNLESPPIKLEYTDLTTREHGAS